MAYRPTIDEVVAYSEQWELDFIEPQDFYDYYEEKGWHKIKSWRMALRAWNKKAEDNWNQPEPTREEVEEYAEQNGLEFVDVEDFYFFYAEDAGWGTVGDWREAMKAWDRRARYGWD